MRIGMSRGPRWATGMTLVAALAVAIPVTGIAREEASPPAEVEPPGWEWEPSVLYYVLRAEPGYFQPTLAVNHPADPAPGKPARLTPGIGASTPPGTSRVPPGQGRPSWRG
jgi:hypothetical protein